MFQEGDTENESQGHRGRQKPLRDFDQGHDTMIGQAFSSVWDAIEDSSAEAENMKLRSSLMIALQNHIVGEGLSQTEAAKILGVTQPRISDLMRGKIDLFAIDSLVNMLGAVGLHVEMRVSKAA
ncbi:helix-turn-helix domain-containing protein [Methylobacterium sp. CM6244]